MEIKVLHDHTDQQLICTSPIFDDMLEKKYVIKASDGAYAYSGLFLTVFNYFNNKIDEMILNLFPDAQKTEMPTLIPLSVYEKGRYFENFPHHIMFQTTLDNDLQVLDEFAKNGTKDGAIFKRMITPTNVLRHAACAPVYAFLGNSKLDSAKPLAMIVSGKCYRNEGNNVFELARLKEFYMKEVVFVGTPEQTAACLEKSRTIWDQMIELFGINCRIETANDSFFASSYKKLKIFQLMGDSKQEFRMYQPGSGTYCAVSSANAHRTHFSKEYNITNDKGYCYTACLAFGVERLAYSLLCQTGLDVSKWDEKTRKEILKNI